MYIDIDCVNGILSTKTYGELLKGHDVDFPKGLMWDSGTSHSNLPGIGAESSIGISFSSFSSTEAS